MWGYSQTDADQTETPDEDTSGEQGGSSDTPETPETPELSDTDVADIINRIESASDGSSVTVDMDGVTVIPAEVLEAAKGKDIDLVLDMGGYTWTISGNDITAGTLYDIDLGVTINSDAIPSSTVQALADGKPVMQISLAHEGDFGFRASLTFNADSGYSDQYANLYYYDSDQRMVYMESSQVDASGNVTFSFSHASDYAVVISDEAMSQADVPEELQPSTGGDQGTGTPPSGDDTDTEDPSDEGTSSGDDASGEGSGDDGSSSVIPDDDADVEDPADDGNTSGDDASGEGSGNDGSSSGDDATGGDAAEGGTTSVTPGDDTDSGSSGADDNTADVPDDNISADGTADADDSTSTDDGASGSSPDITDDGSSQSSGTGSSASSGGSAQTGDNSNVVVWFMLLAAGGVAAVTGISRKRKQY